MISQGTWLLLMKNKSEVGDLIKSFVKLVEVQIHKNVKSIRFNNGLELKSIELYFMRGILHQTP